MDAAARDNPQAGIAFVCFGMLCVTTNDSVVKHLSDTYALHQIILTRSMIGLALGLLILQFEGGFRTLKTSQPLLHLARGLCIVLANILFFAALVSLPLADATALFFVAPLFITMLSIPVLGEKVGIRRIAAVLFGFLGVLIMLRPGGALTDAPDRLTLLLPVGAAFAYGFTQVLTRKLGVSSTAAAMTVYIQGMFIVVSGAFGIVAGDGRFAEGLENQSLIFLLRAWQWPLSDDVPLFLLVGVLITAASYSLANAYRSAAAATIAPFEYSALFYAIILGWLVFGHFPDLWVLGGCALIAGSGIYVFWREKQRAKVISSSRPLGRA
jgi:S-adenosylmethionine uptake transporter